MIKGIIFDLDGTLVNSLEDLHTAVNRMLSYFEFGERTIEESRAAINKGTEVFVSRSLPDEVQNLSFIKRSAIKEYEKQYGLCYLDKTAPYENIEALLMNLKQRGIKLSVLSNKKDKFVKDIVSKLFDKKDFIVIQGQEKLPLKPNSSATAAIIKKMGVKPSQCLIVGDSDVDMQTGFNANIRSVGVCWGYREKEVLENAGATFIIEKPEELCEIVDYLKNESVKRKKNKNKDEVVYSTENCPFFNQKLLGTAQFSTVNGDTAIEQNSKSSKTKDKHGKKTKKGTKQPLIKKTKKTDG